MHPARLVVLASGMGSRLRSKASPKPLVELGGISLVERALAGARQAGFDEVVVVTGHRADQIDPHGGRLPGQLPQHVLEFLDVELRATRLICVIVAVVKADCQ